jgi:L-alanine-DL-glutamate epimerase-like enolase superfamily enzyme
VRADTYCQSLIVHNNAGPLGTAASLHASNASLAAIPNVTLLEAPWVNREAETNVCWPHPKIVDGYALPLEAPGLGIEFDEELAASKPLVPLLQPRLNALDGSVRGF